MPTSTRSWTELQGKERKMEGIHTFILSRIDFDYSCCGSKGSALDYSSEIDRVVDFWDRRT